MNRIYGFMAGILIGLCWFGVAVSIILMSGCMTKYTIEKRAEDGSSVVVNVQSFREFEQPQIYFQRAGEDVVFTFGAESATTGTSPIEEAVAAGIVSGAIRFTGTAIKGRGEDQ